MSCHVAHCQDPLNGTGCKLHVTSFLQCTLVQKLVGLHSSNRGRHPNQSTSPAKPYRPPVQGSGALPVRSQVCSARRCGHGEHRVLFVLCSRVLTRGRPPCQPGAARAQSAGCTLSPGPCRPDRCTLMCTSHAGGARSAAAVGRSLCRRPPTCDRPRLRRGSGPLPTFLHQRILTLACRRGCHLVPVSCRLLSTRYAGMHCVTAPEG